MKDPYRVLGVTRDADEAAIKKAYRKLAKELHPDRHPGDRKIVDRFKEATAAYEILRNKEKRGQYDRGEIDAEGHPRSYQQFRRHYADAEAGGAGDWFAGMSGLNAEDLFSELFSGFRAARSGPHPQGRRGAPPSKGGDRRVRLKIGFLETVKGCKRRLSLGGGKTLEVKIPAAVEDGQTIRLKGQGHAGQTGGPPGDLLVEVTVEAHPFFKRKGMNILVDLPVTLPEAVLGANIAVPTVDGRVSLKIPKGSNSGTTLRLKGRGMLDPKTGQRGDQYMRLQVMLPDKPDEELESLVRKWSEKRAYEVRGKLEDQ